MLPQSDIIKAVHTTLDGINELQNRVYPIVATEGTRLPFAIYTHSTSVDYTKDGGLPELTFTVTIVSATYYDGVFILDKATEEVQRMHGYANYKPLIVGTDEDYRDNEYVFTLTFRL